MALQNPTFRKINDRFICEHCGRSVPPARKTCRNHCPFCLYSKHVDVNPGDRANPCGGLLRPTGYEMTGHKGLMIWFACQKCHAKLRTIALTDDPDCPDDYDLILTLK